MNRCFDDLVFLRKYLYFVSNWVKENFQSVNYLLWACNRLLSINLIALRVNWLGSRGGFKATWLSLLEIEMDTILEDSKSRSILSLTWRIRLVLIVNIDYCPKRIITSFTFGINIARAEAHAHWNIIAAFNRYSIKLAVLVYDLTDNLKLVVSVSLNIRLQCLLANDLIWSSFNLDLYLERIPLENHKFISEVWRVLINGYPYCHRMILQLTVHLIHVESIIQVFLETDYVLQAFPCLPLVHLCLQPAFLL